MQPQQPIGGPQSGLNLPPSGPNGQYDFIINHGKGPGSSWLMNAPLKLRVMIVAGGLGVLLIIALLFLSLISNSGNNAAALLSVVEQQSELARVSQVPIQQATSPAIRNLAAAIQLSLLTDQQVTTTYLKALDGNASAADATKRPNTTDDAALQQASSDGTYDQTYLDIVHKKLATYLQTLKQAYASSSHPNERQLLNREYAHAQLLIDQSKVSD